MNLPAIHWIRQRSAKLAIRSTLTLPQIIICVATLLSTLIPSTLCSTTSSGSTSSPSGSTSSYKSITALNKYGSSPQIQNAQKASDQHGLLTLCALSIPQKNCNEQEEIEGEAIVVVSLERNVSGMIRSQSSSKIQLLAQSTNDNNDVNGNVSGSQIRSKRQILTGMVGSGLKADLAFLSKLMQKHCTNLWERYDSIPDCNAVASAATTVMLAFMKYNVESEVGGSGTSYDSDDDYDAGSNGADGVQNILMDERNGRMMRIDRPLGVNILVLGLSSLQRQRTIIGDSESGAAKGETSNETWIVADVKMVEPSGIVSESIVAKALGKGNAEANKLLSERWKLGMTVEEVESMCVEIIREVVSADGSSNNSFDSKEENGTTDISNQDCLLSEVLSRKGLYVRRLPLFDRV